MHAPHLPSPRRIDAILTGNDITVANWGTHGVDVPTHIDTTPRLVTCLEKPTHLGLHLGIPTRPELHIYQPIHLGL